MVSGSTRNAHGIRKALTVASSYRAIRGLMSTLMPRLGAQDAEVGQGAAGRTICRPPRAAPCTYTSLACPNSSWPRGIRPPSNSPVRMLRIDFGPIIAASGWKFLAKLV